MIDIRKWVMTSLGLLSLGLGSCVHAEKSLTGLIPWEASGHVYSVDTDTLQFLGALEGIIYVRTAEGALDEGFVVCPGSQLFNIKSGKVSGEGHCMITPSAGDAVYAKWTCTGDLRICTGTFNLTGGTGKYEGIKGSSELLVRSSLDELIVGMPSGSVIRSATGITMLPDLEFSIPKKK